MHIRRYFLEYIRNNLKTLPSPSFSGVWIQRIGPSRNSFPCITIYAESESVENLTVHAQPRPQERILTIAVNIWIRGTPDDEKAESDMDSAAVQVEAAMLNNMGADDVILVGTDFNVDEIEPEIHLCKLTYQISYNTREFNPTI